MVIDKNRADTEEVLPHLYGKAIVFANTDFIGLV